MKKIYSVSIELTGDEKDSIQVRCFSYIISANCSTRAMDKAFEEIYKDDDNYNREIIGIHLNRLDELR